MPTVTIRYTLPEEQAEYDAARLGSKMAVALWDIDQRCRALLKHGEPSEETERLAEEIRQMIRDRLAHAERVQRQQREALTQAADAIDSLRARVTKLEHALADDGELPAELRD